MSLGFNDGYTRKETATSSSIGKFHAVKDNGSGLVQETAANADDMYGVAQESADADEDLTIKVDGTTKVEVDGSGTAISKGDFLMPDGSTSGRLVSHTSNAGHTKVAKAREASSAAGDYIIVTILSGETSS